MESHKLTKNAKANQKKKEQQKRKTENLNILTDENKKLKQEIENLRKSNRKFQKNYQFFELDRPEPKWNDVNLDTFWPIFHLNSDWEPNTAQGAFDS